MNLGVEKDEKVNAGQVVKAMIINGLGFVSKPLYPIFRSLNCHNLFLLYWVLHLVP